MDITVAHASSPVAPVSSPVAPASWSDLAEFHLQFASRMFPRSIEVDKQYQAYRNGSSRVNLDVIRQQLAGGERKAWLLLENDFPYSLEPGINHYVFWFRGGYSMEDAYALIKGEFGTESVVFSNLPHNRTVPDINHYHVFIRGTD